MKKFASKILLVSFFAPPVMAQQRSGVVVDFATKEALQNVTIVNRIKAAKTSSNHRGSFEITASAFDTLLFLNTNYQPFKTTVHPQSPKYLDTIFLKRKINNLKEVTVLSGYLKLQQDSIETFKLYHKTIADAKRKAKTIFIPPFFICSDGGITELASKISGQKKGTRSSLQ